MSFKEWKEVKLGDIANYSKKRCSIEDVTVKNYISTENMLENKRGVIESKSIPNVKTISKYNKSDILISNIRPYFKKIWYADKIGGTSNDILIFTVDEKIVDSKYVYYILSQDKFFDYMMKTSKGTKMPRGDKSSILNFCLSIPPLEEQKAIIKILSDLDDKIEVNNKINKNLEEMAQAIFKHWFVDFEFPNEEGKPYKSSGGEMVESELGMIPKGWEVGDLYSVSEVIYGAPFSSKLFNEEGRGLPLIRIRDLKSGLTTFFTDEERRNATIVYPGDILIGMDAEFKPTIWKGNKAYLNQRVCMLKPNKGYVHKYYLYEMIKPYMKFFEYSKVATTVIHLSKGDLDSIKIIKATEKIYYKYFELINPIYMKMINISEEIIRLSNLRDTLLPKLMSGEIRIPINKNIEDK